MNSYLLHFIAYTFAMIGFLVMLLFVYKKAVYSGNKNNNKSFLSVENTLKLSATKTVYVLRAGKEKFLIAGDTANTTMLAKLDDNEGSAADFDNIQKNITELPSVKKHIQRISRG